MLSPTEKAKALNEAASVQAGQWAVQSCAGQVHAQVSRSTAGNKGAGKFYCKAVLRRRLRLKGDLDTSGSVAFPGLSVLSLVSSDHPSFPTARIQPLREDSGMYLSKQ